MAHLIVHFTPSCLYKILLHRVFIPATVGLKRR